MSIPHSTDQFNLGLTEASVAIREDLDVGAVVMHILGFGELLLCPGAAATIASRLITAAVRVRRHQLQTKP
jgi:hypothetical protein